MTKQNARRSSCASTTTRCERSLGSGRLLFASFRSLSILLPHTLLMILVGLLLRARCVAIEGLASARPGWGVAAFRAGMLSLLLAGGAAVPTASLAQNGASTFEVEELDISNLSGDRVDRSTPRSTVEGFVDSASRQDYERAAAYLDLSDLPDDRRLLWGAQRARQLHEIIKARVWIRWESLPDREDGLDSVASSDEPLAGERRRSLLLGVVDLEGRPVEIRINRYEPEEGDPIWLVSRRTVGYVPALYEVHGPGMIEELLPDVVRQEAFWRIPIWQVVALPLILLVSAFAGYIVYRIMGFAERRLASRQDDGTEKKRWLPQIVHRAATPVALFAGAAFVLILNASLLSFSGPASTVVSIATTVALVVAIALVLLRIVGTVLDIVTDNFVASIGEEENTQSRELITNISVTRRIVIFLALVAGTAAVVAQLNLSRSLGVSLLASAGLLSLILGFAAQTVLGNVLASVQLAIAKPIRIGDAINFEGEWGYVEEINFTYVLVQTWDSRRFIVPVRYFVSEPFENWSIRNPEMTKPIEIKLDPTADIEVLRKQFEAILREDPDWDKREDPKTLVIGNDGWTITVRFYASAANPAAGWNLQCRTREKLYAFLRDECGGRWLPRERHQGMEQNQA
ncbi:MAG: mechanosensitive ion channel domain-containing protein [Pseudorhizobium pelagicum]|uniref:mechanosensitive ion channel family protein n=1 Tax=Pseudorhizobium pelagicum TaxID=1509405 RepID=UPI0034612AA3